MVCGLQEKEDLECLWLKLKPLMQIWLPDLKKCLGEIFLQIKRDKKIGKIALLGKLLESRLGRRLNK